MVEIDAVNLLRNDLKYKNIKIWYGYKTRQDKTRQDKTMNIAGELRALETELSVPLLGMTSPMDAQTQSDMTDLVVAALLQRSCNPIQMHLRLKKGFNATFAYDELNGLPTSAKEVAHELARFYVRIADLRARILQEPRSRHAGGLGCAGHAAARRYGARLRRKRTALPQNHGSGNRAAKIRGARGRAKWVDELMN